MLKFCDAVYWLALSTWLSVLIAAGVAAMSAFTHLPDPELGLRLDGFEQFDTQHHGRIAAGKVMEPIFTFVDLVQAPASIIALAMLLLQLTIFRMPWRSPANIVRTLAITIAITLFAWRIFTITPEMNRDLRSYWHAAQMGEVEAAERHLSAFNVHHPRAHQMMRITLILVVIAIASSAAAMTPTARVVEKEELERPKLARKT